MGFSNWTWCNEMQIWWLEDLWILSEFILLRRDEKQASSQLLGFESHWCGIPALGVSAFCDRMAQMMCRKKQLCKIGESLALVLLWMCMVRKSLSVGTKHVATRGRQFIGFLFYYPLLENGWLWDVKIEIIELECIMKAIRYYIFAYNIWNQINLY